jgi:cytidylate kinase
MTNHNFIPVITLDGPSGTGKGTLCHRLAKHLNWHLLDSGAIYRVLALAAKNTNVALDACDALVDLAHHLVLHFDGDDVFLDHYNVADIIRTEQCGQDASKLAAIPEVRAALLTRQRAFAMAPGLVTDGRDMGTVVFPNAALKIYLFASPEARAMRRFLQLKKNGKSDTLAQVVSELSQRDARDTARLYAPLMPAIDAIAIDTTTLTVDDVFSRVLALATSQGLCKGEK